MVTEAEFDEFMAANKDNWRPKQRQAAVQKRWPEPKDQEEYGVWLEKDTRKHFSSPQPGIPLQEILRLISKCNFGNSGDREQLRSAINSGDKFSHMALGKDEKGEIYRIELRTDTIVASSEASTTRPLLPSYILGVNPGVRAVHQKEPSDESVASNETDDGQDGGFTFCQLGKVQHFCGDDVNDPEDDNTWYDTGFGAIIKFAFSGRALGIYLLFDFYPVDNSAGLVDRTKRVQDSAWGKLPGRTAQLSCAKVVPASDLLQISFNYDLRLTEVLYHQVEIVRTVEAGNGGIIRANVTSGGVFGHLEDVKKQGREDERQSGDEDTGSPSKRLALSRSTK